MATSHSEHLQRVKSAVMLMTLDGTITHANASALHLLGHSKDQVLGSAYGAFHTIAHIRHVAEEVLNDDPVVASMYDGTPYRIFGIIRDADRLSTPIEGYVAPIYAQER